MNQDPDLDDNDRRGSDGAANLGSGGDGGGGGENDVAAAATASGWMDATRETSLHHSNGNGDKADCGSTTALERPRARLCLRQETSVGSKV